MYLSIRFFLSIAILISLFTSCNEDDATRQPVITLSELGMENSKQAYIGDELHIEASILAENGIEQIELSIHPEGLTIHKQLQNSFDSGWELDTVFTDYAGLKNTEFHEHFDIPFTAMPGQYHFHLIVTDTEGYQAHSEEELLLLAPQD